VREAHLSPESPSSRVIAEIGRARALNHKAHEGTQREIAKNRRA
jgi:hypothetical protein